MTAISQTNPDLLSSPDTSTERNDARATTAVTVIVDSLQRRVAARGVLLLAIAMVTGGWAGIALSGKVVVAIPHLALAAHLNALFGAFWLLAFAFTLPMLSYSDKAKERLAWLQLVPNYGNWLVTLIASVLGVRGIELTGEIKNDIIAVLLIVVVVVPALVGTVAWVWGFRKRAATTSA